MVHLAFWNVKAMWALVSKTPWRGDAFDSIGQAWPGWRPRQESETAHGGTTAIRRQGREADCLPALTVASAATGRDAS